MNTSAKEKNYGANLRRRKGLFTIETVLIFPLFLFLILFFLDSIFVIYSKTDFKSRLERSMMESKNDLSRLSNREFNQMDRAGTKTENFLNEKLKRSLLDECNLFADEKTFQRRCVKELSNVSPKIRNLSGSVNSQRHSSLFRYAFKMEYDLHFPSLLEKFYSETGVEMNRFKGQSLIKEHRIFDEIVSIDSAYYFVEHSKKAAHLAKKIRTAIEKLK